MPIWYDINSFMKRTSDTKLKKLQEAYQALVRNGSYYLRKSSYCEHLESIFQDVMVEGEGDETYHSIKQKIENDEWEESNPQEFHQSATTNVKHPEMLTDYSTSDFAKMELFKVPGINAGFALKPMEGGNKDIVAVHNNSDVKGIGPFLMDGAIRHGGTHLDHFHGWLTDFYDKAGFVPYKVDAYDPQYDEGGRFRKKYGKMPVVYRSLHPPRRLSPEEENIIKIADQEILARKQRPI